jgi:TBCC domain-containing protein 1
MDCGIGETCLYCQPFVDVPNGFVHSRMSADLGSFVGLGDAGSTGPGPLAPSPFRLPATYEEAKERKVAAVSELRNAVKAVRTLLSQPGSDWTVSMHFPALPSVFPATANLTCVGFKCCQAALDDAKKRELQAVIQTYFKDWLMTSGNMRQVYDLARMERDEAAGSAGQLSEAGPGTQPST